MNRIKKFIASLLLAFLFLVPSIALAASNDQVFGACDQAPSSPACQKNDDTKNPATHIINVAATIIATLTGIAAVVMIIIGGLRYASAGGNAEQTAKAQKQILYSLVGLVVVALAWAMTVFVIDNVIH